MENRRIVVLVGDSLLMDTVEASLGENQTFGVMRIYTTVTGIADRLKSLYPDAIIFDWDTSLLGFVLSFLKDQPGVPLLGLDLTCSKVIALFSEQHLTLTANDLVRVVNMHTSGKARAIDHIGDIMFENH